MSESSKFTVSVWRAFVPKTALVMSAVGMGADTEQPEIHVLTKENTDLQKEVFCWRMLEDPFGGIADQSEREKLREQLLEKMAIRVDPRQRSVESLRSFVDAANRVLADGGVEWSGSQSPLGDGDEGKRLNPLLALVNQLSWLIDVFEGQPNTSVSVR